MSKMNRINSDTCKTCGLCAATCPNQIIVKNEFEEMVFRPERIHLCFKCGHCMAICPTKSVIIDGLSYEKDFFEFSECQYYENQFYKLISDRRSIRCFKDKSIPQDILKKIVDAISTAPISFPPSRTEITVVNNRDIIKKALPHFIHFYDKLRNMLKKPIIRFFMKREMNGEVFNTLKNHVLKILDVKLPYMKKNEEDAIIRNAPTIIIFHAKKNSESHTTDIHIAITYGLLAAHSLGLGATMIDLIPPAIERTNELRDIFRIPKDNEVIASMIVGYPKYTFQRGIQRNLANLTWI
ncbi:MAG: nitroreductase family protein [Promethearchaeota archaeon]